MRLPSHSDARRTCASSACIQSTLRLGCGRHLVESAGYFLYVCPSCRERRRWELEPKMAALARIAEEKRKLEEWEP